MPLPLLSPIIMLFLEICNDKHTPKHTPSLKNKQILMSTHRLELEQRRAKELDDTVAILSEQARVAWPPALPRLRTPSPPHTPSFYPDMPTRKKNTHTRSVRFRSWTSNARSRPSQRTWTFRGRRVISYPIPSPIVEPAGWVGFYTSADSLPTISTTSAPLSHNRTGCSRAGWRRRW